MPEEGVMRAACLLILPLALAACGGPEDSKTPDQPAATATPAAVGGAKLVVTADGVGAKGQPPLRFGTPRGEVDPALEAAFGETPVLSRNAECGAGPMDFSQFGPLQVGYLDGKLAGWFLRADADRADSVVTSDGVRPGANLAALRAERDVRDVPSTLDGEFTYVAPDYGTITGFADEGGTITALAAGITCVFR